MASSNNIGGNHSKIVGLLGVAAAVFIGVTWILPKFERHHGMALGFHIPDEGFHHHPHAHAMHHGHPHHPGGFSSHSSHHIYDTPVFSPTAEHIAKSGPRDYNMAGLAIEAGGVSLNGIA